MNSPSLPNIRIGWRTRTAQRWVPLATWAVVVTAVVVLWRSLLAQEKIQLHREIAGQTSVLKTKLQQLVEQRILAIDRMARRWEMNQGTPLPQWRSDAQQYIAQQPGYQAIGWVDPSFRTRWIVPEQQTGSASYLDLTSEVSRRQVLEAARDQHEIAVTETLDLVPGGKGFVIYAPLYVDAEFDGFIASLLRVEDLIDQMLPAPSTAGYSMVLYDEDQEIYRRDNSFEVTSEMWAHEAMVNLRGAKWRMCVSPTPEMLAVVQSRLPETALYTGLLIASLLSISAELGQTARLQSQRLAATLEQLQAEVAQREQVQKQIAQREKELSDFFDNAAVGLHWLSPTGVVMRVNQCALDMLGYAREEFMGRYIGDFHVDSAPIEAMLERLAAGETMDNHPARLRSKDGALKHVEITSNIYKENGKFAHTRCFVRDVTDRKQAEQAIIEVNRMLQLQAETDALTQLANRRRFYEKIDVEWKRCQRAEAPIAVAMLDVDCFKNYNDSLGHLAGDDCLKRVAQAIQDSMQRGSDFAARYGGEEFAVVLPDTDDAGAAQVCETIRQAIRDLAILHPSSPAGRVVTISTGYTSVVPTPGMTIREFLHEADTALYHAKEEGRDCVVGRSGIASMLIPKFSATQGN